MSVPKPRVGSRELGRKEMGKREIRKRDKASVITGRGEIWRRKMGKGR